MNEECDQLGLTGRTALVSGAAGALGNAILRALADAGATVVGVDLHAAAEIRTCDVTDERAVDDFVQDAVAHEGVTDIVHAAGALALGSVRDTPASVFRRVVEVNLTGSYIVARAALRHLAPGGTLTLVSSQAGLKGGALWSAYSASKGGVNRLVDCLAEESAELGIRVNALCPGSVDSPMADRSITELSRITGQTPAEIRERYRRSIPIGRPASLEEVARACLLLISPLSSYVHGTALVVDGGELTR